MKDEESASFSELHMLVRKQLSNPDPQYKHVGVIGAVSLMAQLCAKDAQAEVFLATAKELFETMRKSCDLYPAATSLGYDELAYLITLDRFQPLFVWYNNI